MAGTIQRLREVLENLPARPGTRIFLPAIGKSGEGPGLIDAAQRFKKEIVLRGEIFLREQHLTAFISRQRHGCNRRLSFRDANATAGRASILESGHAPERIARS